MNNGYCKLRKFDIYYQIQKKFRGETNISKKAFGSAIDFFSYCITHFINVSFNNGYFPITLNISKIVSVH